ncbi:hypothetical protein X975_01285, partial [Stegodyphus mimosarum]
MSFFRTAATEDDYTEPSDSEQSTYSLPNVPRRDDFLKDSRTKRKGHRITDETGKKSKTKENEPSNKRRDNACQEEKTMVKEDENISKQLQLCYDLSAAKTEEEREALIKKYMDETKCIAKPKPAQTVKEGPWIAPKKVAKIAETQAPMEIVNENRFQILQQLVEPTTEGGASEETPPPPIVFDSRTVDWMEIDEHLQLRCAEPYECKMKAQSIFMYTKNLKDYSLISQYLIEQNIPHHTYKYECEKPIKAILKNIPASFTEEAIIQELNRRKFPVTKISIATASKEAGIKKLAFFYRLHLTYKTDTCEAVLYRFSSFSDVLDSLKANYIPGDLFMPELEFKTERSAIGRIKVL